MILKPFRGPVDRYVCQLGLSRLETRGTSGGTDDAGLVLKTIERSCFDTTATIILHYSVYQTYIPVTSFFRDFSFNPAKNNKNSDYWEEGENLITKPLVMNIPNK